MTRETRELHPNPGAQEDFLRSPARFPALIMGQGGGKSWGGAAKLLVGHYHFRGTDSIVVEPTFPLIKQIALPTVCGLLDKLNAPYTVKLDPIEVTTTGTRSKIVFHSGLNAERITGFQAGRGWLDEPARIPDQLDPRRNVWFNVLARCRHPLVPPKFRQIWATGTHEGKGSWFYRKWEENRKPGYEVHRGSTTENPSPGIAEYAALLRDEYGPELAAQYVEGYAVEDSLSAMTWADITACQTTDAPIVDAFDWLQNEAGPLFVGMDIGRTKSLTVFWVLRRTATGFATVGVLILESADFGQQAAFLAVLGASPAVTTIAIDATYNPQTCEDAEKRFGTTPRGKIMPVVFGPATKLALIQRLILHVREHTIELPEGETIAMDFYGLKRIVTAGGVVRYEAPFTPDGHSDRAIAAALALAAAGGDVGPATASTSHTLRTSGLRGM